MLLAQHPEFAALRHRADSLLGHASAASTTPGDPNYLLIGGVHYIPVVVHIIHTGESIGNNYNPSDQAIIDYIDRLNQAFSATYPGYPTTATGGQDIGIQFVLAQRSPDCAPTNGIVRVNAATKLGAASLAEYTNFGVNMTDPFSGISYDTMAAMSYWSNLEYYNIWLVRSVGSIGGFAFYPTGTATIYDGAVINIFDVNSGTPDLIAHEMGHAFGLYHTFHGEANGNCPPNTQCATEGDMICDTDPHLANTNGCDSAATNPCTGQLYGDVVSNYMSYSCARLFTAGQKNRMLDALTTLRTALDTSLGGSSLALFPPGSNLFTPSVTISASHAALCAGGTITFTATPTYGGLTPSYQWRVNGANVGLNSPNPVFATSSLPNNAVVSCLMTSSISSACITTDTASSNSIQIPVSTAPVPTISISTSNGGNIFCASVPVTFNATVANAGANPVFSWKVNGVTAGTTGSGSFSFIPVAGDVVDCELSNTPCSGYTVNSNSIMLYVNPMLYPTIAITVDTTDNCIGGSMELQATYSYSGPPFIGIDWYVNNTIVASGVGPHTVPLNTAGNMEVYARMSTYYSCSSPQVLYSDTVNFQVNAAAQPAIQITTASTQFCAGDLVSFQANATYGGNAPVYEWQVNGMPAGTNTPNYDYYPADGDVVTCLLTSNLSCALSSGATSNPLILQADNPPAPVVTDYGSYLGSNYPNGQNQWYEVTTGLLPGEVNQLFHPSVSGHYYDIVTVNGCPSKSSDTLEYTMPTSIYSPEGNGMTPFYPNPSTGVFSVPGHLIGSEAVIINQLGQVVHRTRLDRILYLESLGAGIYLLKPAADKSRKVYRLTIK